MDVRVELSRIIITETGEQQVIVLRERDGSRAFPIAIGIAEVLAIDRRIKGVVMARPMTHDLLANIIEQLGAHLDKIVIDDLRDHTFFAKLHVVRDGDRFEIDSRPSDAIALGVANNVPIYVSESVLNEACQA